MKSWTYFISISSKELIEYGGKLYCENKTVYHKPHIKIEMSNNEVITQYFKSEEDLNSFMNSPEMQRVKWIRL